MINKMPNKRRYVFKKRCGHKMYRCPLCGTNQGMNGICFTCGAHLVKKPLPMVKIIIITTIVLIPVMYFAWGKITGNCIGNFHIQSVLATCEEDSTCMVCGKVLEKATGHIYPENRADCDENVQCRICGAVRPKLANHLWLSATCKSPSVCANCGQQYNNAVRGHDYVNGTCSRCGDKTFGIWEKKFFVDKYGDKTNNPYIYGEFTGKFSNSATTNSKADGYWIISKNEVSIVILKYGSQRLKGASYETRFYDMSIKMQNGKEQGLDGTLSKNDDRITIDDYQNSWVTDILKRGGQIKIYIKGKYDPYKDEEYVFTMEDVSGFSNIFNTL